MSSHRFGALLASFCLFTSSVFAQSPLKLIPIPREVHATGDLALLHGVRILCAAPCSAEDQFAADDLAMALQERGVQAASATGVSIELVRVGAHPEARFSDEMKAEGYMISASGGGLTVIGDSAAGVFYGAQTVKQLIEGDGARAVLHAANVRDWPAMKYRGLDDDLSRGPVTTLEFQKHLIRTLAAYKINLYSPYFEHTQQYASNPLMAPPGGSVTAEEARELVAYAKQYHIDVVPEQEAFGHLHHNLTWEQYQPLAETPHGAVLAPGQPESIALIKQMFTELAALYPGPFLHIGADETVDLGLGQTKADVDTRGLAPVYLDFLQRIVTELKPLNRRFLFWGDIAQDSPDLLKGLPQSFKDSTIAIAWVYSPEARGYDRFLTPFTNAGMETWVAPSVNNFRKVYPNNNYALANIQRFTADGQRLGSTGQLNTIWNDDGEGLFNQDWYGILFGAAAAWQKGESSIPDFENSYAQVFHGDMTGYLNEAQKEMMLAHAVLKDQAKQGDGSNSIFWLDPMSKDGQRIGAQVLPYVHDVRLHAERALTLIAQARAAAPAAPPVSTGPKTYDPADSYPSASTTLRETAAIDALELGARRMDLIGLKFQLSEEIAEGYQRAYAMQNTTDKKQRMSVSRELSDINGVNGRIQDFIDAYSLLRDLYEQAWYRSNRAYALRPVLEHYDYTVGIWEGRSDRVRSAQRQWSDNHTLPPAADLGIPPPAPAAK
ncbi:glycoside hydrolase family 20 zincin-like fold domain-containing protein [Granulicella sp. S190]|uniref:glycoside hydrolase family 20 zincin-like fold domain-containing protein n=1 Tax=Granulicella sp. S190 TaxID=1747226 RepID=UPI00131A8FFF|nr:glycoside hydrolase family 20 zincin-like fold domain-containing protein [Granulicella sp. S190]